MLILLTYLAAAFLSVGDNSTPLPPIKLPFPPLPLITTDAGPHSP